MLIKRIITQLYSLIPFTECSKGKLCLPIIETLLSNGSKSIGYFFNIIVYANWDIPQLTLTRSIKPKKVRKQNWFWLFLYQDSILLEDDD